MMKSPPSFRPGPLTPQAAEALNRLAHDLYALRFSTAPPLNFKHDAAGVRHWIDTTALLSNPPSGISIPYTNDAFNYVSSTSNYDSASDIIYDETPVSLTGSSIPWSIASDSTWSVTGADDTATLAYKIPIQIQGFTGQAGPLVKYLDPTGAIVQGGVGPDGGLGVGQGPIAGIAAALKAINGAKDLLQLTGASGQTNPLLDLLSSTGGGLGGFGPAGQLGAGTTPLVGVGAAIVPPGATGIGAQLQGLVSQTGDLLRLLDNTGAVLSKFLAGGQLNLPASTTSKAGLNISQGTAPTSPVNGDVWVDTLGKLWWQGAGSSQQAGDSSGGALTSGQSTLTSYAVTSGWANTGLSIGPLAAGTYTVIAQVNGLMTVSGSIGNTFLQARLYDGSAQVGQVAYVATAPQGASAMTEWGGTASLVQFDLVLTVSTTIYLQASATSTTNVSSSLSNCVLGYEKTA